MNICGKKVVLRAMEMEDCELAKDMFNDPEIESLVGGWAFPVSLFAQKKWMESNYNNQHAVRFVIDTKEDGPVGIFTLTDIDWKNRSATIGAKLASDRSRGKGYGTDSTMAIMRYVFDELGFHRLEVSWLATNTVSPRVLTKCGFVKEGIKRDFVYKGGKYRDLVEAGILANEYYELINTNHYWDN